MVLYSSQTKLMAKTTKERYAENPEYYRAKSKLWRENNADYRRQYKHDKYQLDKNDPVFREKLRLRWQRWYQANKAQAAAASALRYVRRKYKLTREQALRFIEQRNRGCQVCGSKARPAIDHCHKTSKVRGILCSNCNMAIGFAMDNPEILEALANYIRKFHKPKSIKSKDGQPPLF